MNNTPFLNTLNSIVANATPLVIASLGETITERAGMINLSLNGSIVLAAMLGFAAASAANSVMVGLFVAMLVGAVIALIIAVAAIDLRRDQVAVGFILTLLAADLAKFLGQSYHNQPGPTIPSAPVPVLREFPVVGTVLFQHDLFVYFSFFLVFVTWYWLFHSRPGLSHRAVGEHPEAAFARGTRVNFQRYLYTAVGGALVGLAGAGYSLGIKAGWAASPKMDGDGWIALAIVIFGGWHPFRVVFGAYLFAALRAAASNIQRGELGIPLVLLNALPWLLMIVTLMLVSSGAIERIVQFLPRSARNRARAVLQSTPPKALGRRFEPE